jgi:adenylate cyclase
MNQDRDKLKLSAILSADVVGYSRLMEEDQAWTIKNLEENKTLISDLVEEYRGRVVDAPGDNLLAEFSSITNAVECAVKIQSELKKKNSKLIEKHRMEFRIGINLGEVFEEGGRIYGSGVNIAARIEGLSKSGGICISGGTYDHIKRKFDFSYEYLGEHIVKNISEPIRVYNLLMKSSPSTVIHKEKSKDVPSSGEKKPSTLSDKPSIVVLPFVNISGDPEQEYFSDGMTEEIINALTNIDGLKVISRTSSFFFKGKDVDLRNIGEKLNVDNVIEGSVRKAGNKIRITAQLIKVADDTHLWSKTYNRDLDDIFAIQEEISKTIVESLKVHLFTKEKESLIKTYTENIDAYESYIKGRYSYLSFRLGGMEKALQYYNQAITFDPYYAPAYSAIAECYWELPFTGQKISKDEVYSKARNAVNTALEIDNNLPEAHANLGLIKFLYEWDWKGAEKHFKTAIKLNPGLAKPHYDYALYMATMGDVHGSIFEARKGLELDPLNSIPHFDLGYCYYIAGQFDQTLKEARQALELTPTLLSAIWLLISSYNMKGMFKEAMDEINKGLTFFPKDTLLLRQMGHIYAQKGEKDKTREILDELLAISKKEYVTPFAIAPLYAELGDTDLEFEYLDEAYRKRDIFFIFFAMDYRDDPKFKNFINKMGC